MLLARISRLVDVSQPRSTAKVVNAKELEAARRAERGWSPVEVGAGNTGDH
jgi:hypothetical protein